MLSKEVLVILLIRWNLWSFLSIFRLPLTFPGLRLSILTLPALRQRLLTLALLLSCIMGFILYLCNCVLHPFSCQRACFEMYTCFLITAKCEPRFLKNLRWSLRFLLRWFLLGNCKCEQFFRTKFFYVCQISLLFFYPFSWVFMNLIHLKTNWTQVYSWNTRALIYAKQELVWILGHGKSCQ